MEESKKAAAPEEEASVEEQADQVSADLDELGETKRERDEYLDLAQRTRADFENYRKRAAREAEEARARSKAEIAGQLIPIVDNLERALEASGDATALADGVKLIHRDLGELLERIGVEAYDPAGERFDPTWHEALQTRPAEGAEPGQVIETLDKGYRLNGQALRPARVVVSE
jgi:molecular chaperone GrpE